MSFSQVCPGVWELLHDGSQVDLFFDLLEDSAPWLGKSDVCCLQAPRILTPFHPELHIHPNLDVVLAILGNLAEVQKDLGHALSAGDETKAALDRGDHPELSL